MKYFTKHKQLLFKLVTTSLFLFSMVMANAATITWNGGIGNWQKPSNWDLNRLPNSNDRVIVSTGTVILTINGYCESIYVDHDAQLNIEQQGELNIEVISQVYGLENHGIVQNSGVIILDYNGLNYGKQGIKNFGEFYSEGTIDIMGDFNHGILNELKGHFENDGFIYIDLSGNGGIENLDYFINRGLIEIKNVSKGIFNLNGAEFVNNGDIEIIDTLGSTSNGLANKGLFTNNTNGNIEIEGITTTSSVLQNWNNNAEFRNKGDITISNCRATFIIKMDGNKFTNYQTGTISTDNCTGPGIWRTFRGTTKNEGEINITNIDGLSIFIRGQFNNEKAGRILVNNVRKGFYVEQNYTFNNGGLIEITNATIYSALVRGSFINNDFGTFKSSGKLEFQSTATVANNGHIISSYNSGDHPINIAFSNFGVVNDIYHVIDDSDIKQYGILVRPFYEVLSPGKKVYDALDVYSLTDFTVLKWYTSENGSTIVGSYNSSTNIFVPNNNVSGLNSIWVEIKILNSNKTERHEIILTAGTKSLLSSTTSEILEEDQEQIEITIGPNPATEYLNINSRINSNQLGSFELINLKGQKLLSGEIELNGDNKINFSNSISSGIYFLNIWSENKLIIQEKVVVQK